MNGAGTVGGPPPAVRFDAVCKRFPGVVALDGVTFEVAAGSCHALCGENGAGKSTLGKILAGVQAPDGGRIFVEGREVHFASPREALDAGVAMVHQELAFCPNLTVAENLCLGRPARARPARAARGAAPRGRGPCWPTSASRSTWTAWPGSLTVGQQQMVQIAAGRGHAARA